MTKIKDKDLDSKKVKIGIVGAGFIYRPVMPYKKLQ